MACQWRSPHSLSSQFSDKPVALSCGMPTVWRVVGKVSIAGAMMLMLMSRKMAGRLFLAVVGVGPNSSAQHGRQRHVAAPGLSRFGLTLLDGERQKFRIARHA